MNGFSLNKISTAILLASLIIMVISNLVDIIYTDSYSENTPRGYKIETGTSTNVQTTTNAKEENLDINAINALLSKANAEKGKSISKKCVSCHTFEKGGANRVGPNLWGIINKNKAHLGDDFAYSKAMKTKGGTWVIEDLFHFLHKPQSFIAGTKMTFIGISKSEDIADLIAYLNTMTDSPISLKTSDKQ